MNYNESDSGVQSRYMDVFICIINIQTAVKTFIRNFKMAERFCNSL